jgi:hypothetical protein
MYQVRRNDTSLARAGVAEQSQAAAGIATAQGGSQFAWATAPEERKVKHA